ncbi:MAG: hypothetical protein QOE14_2784 [Humisphaera sp.]|nr:hypothetical protein [Humisphaera sp.]
MILAALAAGAAWPCLPSADAQSTAAAPPGAVATTSSSTADPAAVLRAPNIPQRDRDEAAAKLILRRTPEARQLLVAAMADATNRSVQRAAARAVALDPDPDPAFINPLFDLIGADPALTDAAIQALAGYRAQASVAAKLIALAVDAPHQQREATRLAAIRAVGTMPNKPAARALMDLLNADAESPAIRTAAAVALGDMTAAGVKRTDPAHWQRWWTENQIKDDASFARDLLEARDARLVRLQNRFDRYVGEMRAILEEVYQSAPEKNKEAILLRYLRSPEPETRAMGATIVQSDFTQTRPIPPAVRDELRGMLTDSSSQVRIAVAQALFLLNDAQAFDALLAQLAREQDADVRMELARALVPMRDVRVVQPLVKLLSDPSPAVAETAARGLGDSNLAPLIQRDPALSTLVAQELTVALTKRTGQPGTTSLRAALIDAMGALRNPNLHRHFTAMLKPNESVVVRRAALRALGQYGKPNGEIWPAGAVGEGLRDGDDTVRLEAVRALRTTADFSHASILYDLIKRDSPEPSQSVRDEAWAVLKTLFSDPSAGNAQLAGFADAFKGEPERRIEVLKVLAERLASSSDPQSQSSLASFRSSLGAEYMELAKRAAERPDLDAAAREQAVIENAKQADIYFDLALKHYRAKDPRDQGMTTSDLLERRMDALLASKQYQTAADFAASSITANTGNQEAMGRKINTEADRLRDLGALTDALRLIEAAKRMDPPLVEPSASSIERLEAAVRAQLQNQAPTNNPITTPRSAVGSGQ